jgi:hypothetical protein
VSKTKTENVVSIENVKKEIYFPGITNSDLVLCSKNHAASERQKGQQLPTCRPASDIGAVEAALRASAERTTAQIFYPTTGLVFDSVEEAYEFYRFS